jgi:hypothetical protein
MSGRFGGKRSGSAADHKDDLNPEIFIINYHVEPGKIEKFVLRLKDDPHIVVGKFAAKTKMTALAKKQMLEYALASREKFIEECNATQDQQSPNSGLENDMHSMGLLKQKGFSSKFSESLSQKKPQIDFEYPEKVHKLTTETLNGNRMKVRPETSASNMDKSNESNIYREPARFKALATEPGKLSQKEDLQGSDEFANRIARQIEQASQLIYKTEGSSRHEKSSAKVSRPLSAQKSKTESSSSNIMKVKGIDNQTHQQSKPHQNVPALDQSNKTLQAKLDLHEASFRSFNDGPRKSIDRQNRSQTGEEAEKLFLKLYNDGLLKHAKRSKQVFEKQMREEAEIMKTKIDQGKRFSSEIVDRLYYKGIVKEDVKKFNNERIRTLQEVEKTSEYSYHPRISNISRIIAENREERTNLPIEDYLISKGQSKNKYLEQASAAKLGDDLKECQEKPRISETSKILAYNRSQIDEGRPRMSKHEELFEESTQRRHRSIILQEAYNADMVYNYQPAINEESRKIVESKHGQQSFVERLAKYASDKEAKLMIEKARLHPPFSHIINPETNMPYFHPATGRPPSTARESEIVGVGAYLHGLNSKFKEKLEHKRDEMYDRKSREREAIPQSSHIVDKRKSHIFKSLFDSLDSDNDGVISAEKINIEVIQSDILKIISPMLINMEELSMEIDEETFIYGMQEIYKKLCVADRDKLLGGFKPRRIYSDDDCTFKPNLNSNSLRLAANKKSIVETVHIAATRKRADLKNKYEIDSEGNALTMINEENSDTRSNAFKYSEDLQHCTFQPRLNDYVPIKSHYI